MILTDEQILEEAKERISKMTDEEKSAIKDNIRQGYQMTDKVVSTGYKSLTQEERKIYMQFNTDSLKAQSGGGFEYASIEAAVKEQEGVSREEIASMKKNPFAKSMWITLILVVVIGIGGIVGTAAVAKTTGWDLKYVYMAISAATGLLSLRFASQLLQVIRFRKLQKAYQKTDFQESEIEAAKYRLLKREVAIELNRDPDR
jgi:hypothetical protein